jgi:hypothetical protein
MVVLFSCKTTNPVQFQESGQAQTALVVATATGPVQIEYSDDGIEEPIPDLIESNTSYTVEKELSLEPALETQNEDTPVGGHFEPSGLPAAYNKTTEEEMEESRDISENEGVSDSKQTFDKKSVAVKTVTNEYYVQVGSWKNLNYAEEIFIKVKEMYHHANLVTHNNFFKIRISGVMSKREGVVISKNIKETLNLKSLLVLKTHSISLDDAVRPFIGTSYTKIDCYGLIVRGLINQGIQYHGHGGLMEKLENLALHNGLPNNAYLNGEGLVEKAGTKIFSNSIQRIFNIREETDKIYNGITPYLRKGTILSFSTTSHGHTGIVSRWEGHWTYINSGLIDNQITSSQVSERVGEEFLKAEIKNWVVLASSRKEPLTVTLGEIDENPLPDFDWPEKTDRLTALNMY